MAKLSKREWRGKAHFPENSRKRGLGKEWRRVKAEQAEEVLAEIQEEEWLQEDEAREEVLVEAELEDR